MKKSLLLLLIGWMTVVQVMAPLASAPEAFIEVFKDNADILR